MTKIINTVTQDYTLCVGCEVLNSRPSSNMTVTVLSVDQDTKFAKIRVVWETIENTVLKYHKATVKNIVGDVVTFDFDKSDTLKV